MSNSFLAFDLVVDNICQLLILVLSISKGMCHQVPLVQSCRCVRRRHLVWHGHSACAIWKRCLIKILRKKHVAKILAGKPENPGNIWNPNLKLLGKQRRKHSYCQMMVSPVYNVAIEPFSTPLIPPNDVSSMATSMELKARLVGWSWLSARIATLKMLPNMHHQSIATSTPTFLNWEIQIVMTLSDSRRGISGPRVPKISDENFRSHAPKPFCPSDHFGLLVVTCI